MMMNEDLLFDSNDESQQMCRDRLNIHGTYSSENESGFFNESSSRAKDVQALEQEYEQLSSSLMALTSHFARVQFRLKQVVDAPTEDKDVSSIINIKFFELLVIISQNFPSFFKLFYEILSQSPKKHTF